MDGSIERLLEIVAHLRSETGCPWDREQTHQSLRSSLLEESYEVLAAIDAGDDENLREELGDLLLNVVMQAQIASERDAFTLDAIIGNVCEKLIRRHPHVFGDQKAANAEEVITLWDKVKREEKKESFDSILHEVSPALPALMHAQKVQKKAAKVGFDWPDEKPVMEKIQEELGELTEAISSGNTSDVREEAGDLLFSVVNLLRKLNLDSELTLREATVKFMKRFAKIEKHVRAQNQTLEDLTLAEMDAIWDVVKKQP